jgi:hypothetical protein
MFFEIFIVRMVDFLSDLGLSPGGFRGGEAPLEKTNLIFYIEYHFSKILKS